MNVIYFIETLKFHLNVQKLGLQLVNRRVNLTKILFVNYLETILSELLHFGTEV